MVYKKQKIEIIMIFSSKRIYFVRELFLMLSIGNESGGCTLQNEITTSSIEIT